MENRNRYDELIPSYNRLANNIIEVLERFFKESEISILKIDSRIKSYDSIIEKIDRKGYADPFKEIEDICGIRIICYYQTDIDKISEIIKKEFKVLEDQNKESLLNTDQFGYRSHHFIVKIPNDWIAAPNYRGLENLKVEIQIRTVLMHAWAEIQHKLAYKKEYQIEEKIKRKFSMLSSALEDADDKFEELRNQSKKYREGLIKNQKTKQNTFTNLKYIDLDSLQAFLDYYFPDRKRDKSTTSSILEELIEATITFRELNEILDDAKDFAINIMEKEHNVTLTQGGMINWSLILVNERYWEYFKNTILINNLGMLKKFEDWRNRFKNKAKPMLTVEIIKDGGLSIPKGYSPKNKVNKNGYIDGNNAIIVFELNWHFKIMITNNSDIIAFYPELEFNPNGPRFSLLKELNLQQPIKPAETIELKAEYKKYEEVTGKERTDIGKELPDEFNYLEILLKYQTSTKSIFYTLYNFSDDKKKNLFLTSIPTEYKNINKYTYDELKILEHKTRKITFKNGKDGIFNIDEVNVDNPINCITPEAVNRIRDMEKKNLPTEQISKRYKEDYLPPIRIEDIENIEIPS